MNIAICCIAKGENNYIREWVEYHIDLGFSKVFIYDNNDTYGEIFNDILEDYIAQEIVRIIDCRGKKAYQLISYSDFYKTYGNDYDWIAFIDVDEYITLSRSTIYSSISDFLYSKSNFDLIHINWMCFGDNNIINHESYKILNRFTAPLEFDKIVDGILVNNHVKSIIKGGRNTLTWDQPHTPVGKFKTCNSDGIELNENSPYQPYSFKTIYIRHFCTKTISEWIQRINKGNADGNYVYPIDKFFQYNIRTKEKEEIVNQYLRSRYQNDLSLNESEDTYRAEEKALHFQKQALNLSKEIERIYSSKSYRLGKFILKPFSSLRKVSSKSL